MWAIVHSWPIGPWVCEIDIQTHRTSPDGRTKRFWTWGASCGLLRISAPAWACRARSSGWVNGALELPSI